MAMYKEYKYVSYGTHGVDATAFYKKFGLTITDVSRKLGISRQSVSRLPIEGASKENTEKMLLYLEEYSTKRYVDIVEKSRQNICLNLENIKAAWLNYKEQEEILEKYRCKYGIKRKAAAAEELPAEEILKRIKVP